MWKTTWRSFESSKGIETGRFNSDEKQNNIKKMNKAITIASLLLAASPIVTSAQNNVVVSPATNITVFGGTQMSIWGNLKNSGNFTIEQGGKIIFYGDTLTNTAGATMPGAGRVSMTGPRPAPLAGSFTQYLNGGGNTASMPSLEVNNINNLVLVNTDAKARDTFEFVNGYVILNNQTFTLGNTTSGAMLGYTDSRYFVTGSDSIGGYVAREAVNGLSGSVAFPIGHRIGLYTPASLINTGATDIFKARVLNLVSSNGFGGTDQNNRSTQTTWQVLENTPGGSNVTLSLQHSTLTEGDIFTAYREHHYISRFTGIAPNNFDTVSNTKWDMVKWANTTAGTQPGTITTGTPIGLAMVTTRSGFSELGLFAKTIYSMWAQPLPIHVLSFNAAWKGNDAALTWTVDNNADLLNTEVQYSLDGINFVKCGLVKNNNQNGSMATFNFLHTNMREMLTGDKVYYRLNFLENNGTSNLSEIKMLKKEFVNKNISSFVVFPNPTLADIKLGIIDGLEAGEAFKYMIFDMTGRMVASGNFTGTGSDQVIDVPEVAGFIPGTYNVRVTGANTLLTGRFIKQSN